MLEQVYLLEHETKWARVLKIMIRHDLFRALGNKNFVLACVFGFIALAHGLADYEPGISARVAHLPPFYINAYDAFVWAHNGIIGIIAPLIVTLPFADSLALDRSSGYLRFILLRTSRRNYLLSKMFACALAGGLSITLPFVVMYGYTSLTLPRGLPSPEQSRIVSDARSLGPFGALYREAPDVYIWSLLGLIFIFGMIYAIFGLSLSALTENRYVILSTPFLMCNILHFILSVLGLPQWSPGVAFVPHWIDNVGWIHIISSLSLVLLASLVLIGRMFRSLRSHA